MKLSRLAYIKCLFLLPRVGEGGCLQIQISIVIQSSNPLLGKKIYLWTSERIFSFPVRLLEYIRANKAHPWDGVPIVLGKRASHPFRSRGKSSSSANRMYSGFSNIPMILGLIWSIRSRPVCHSVDHSAPSIRVPLPSPNNDSSQHSVPDWNRWDRIYLFPTITMFPEVVETLRTFWGPRNPK